MRRRAAMLAGVVLALTLSGCIAPPTDTALIAQPSEVVESESSAPAAATEPMAVPEQGTPEWAALSMDEQIEVCEAAGSMIGCTLTTGECSTTTFAASDDPVQVAGWKPEVAVDQGASEYATGEALVNANGMPVAYVVGAGDVPDFVADRFCMNFAYLHAINSVRRASLAGELYAGDTINLDATTIFTVGDQNGVVHDGEPPLPHPPQQ